MRQREPLKSPVREIRTPGSVRGPLGNRRSYRDAASKHVAHQSELVYDSPRNFAEEANMTKALEEVFREASKLPEAEQNALAEAIRAEMQSEKDWDKSFADSLDILERLADEAIADHRAGRTKPVDPDKM
jgi:hypothetical protein